MTAALALAMARNFRNWLFAPASCELPQTERIIKRTLDVRMPLQWDDADFDVMYASAAFLLWLHCLHFALRRRSPLLRAEVIKEAIDEVFGA